MLILIEELIAAPAGDIVRERRLGSRTLAFVLSSAEVVGVTLHAEMAERGALFVTQLETVGCRKSEQNMTRLSEQ